MKTLPLIPFLVIACNTAPTSAARTTASPPPEPMVTAPSASAAPAPDKNAVLAKLTGSRADIARLKKECQLLYSDAPAQSLGSIAGSQYREANAWEASCTPGADRRYSCTVTLSNDAGEDEEFMSRFTFELDKDQALIESSVDCVFAG